MLNRHCIQQQHLQVHLLGSEAQGFALQNRISNWARDWLQPALEQLFDQLVPDDQWLTIDALHLDLGTLPWQDLEHQLLPRLIEQLRQALLQHQTQNPSQYSTTASRLNDQDTALQPSQSQQRLFQAFCHFLRCGLLPWWFNLPPGKTLENLLLASWQSPQSISLNQRQTLKQLLQQAWIKQRLLQQLSVPAQWALLQQLEPRLADAIASLIKPSAQNDGQSALNSASRAFAQTPDTAQCLAQAYQVWLEYSHANSAIDWRSVLNSQFGFALASPDTPIGGNPSAHPLADRQTESLTGQQPAIASTPQQPTADASTQTRIAESSSTPASVSAVVQDNGLSSNPVNAHDATANPTPRFAQQLSRDEANTPTSSVTAKTQTTQTFSDQNNRVTSPPTHNHEPASIQVVSEPSVSTVEQSEATIDTTSSTRQAPSTEPVTPAPATASSIPTTIDWHQGIYLDNAGLILLHPFLPQLFGALSVTQDNQIVDIERGLQLLHFLATGHPVAPEYQLPLAKLLLNWPMEYPVATLQPLSEDDQAEALALLKAVIRHWQALGDSSPDGLRGTFLLRPGKLSRRDDGDWRLQVENQGFDILLNQLPWGFGMIRLPWMANWLWVEWSY